MRGRAWLIAGLAALALPALIDAATGDDAFARSLYLLPVLAAATRARPGEVGAIGVAATALAVLSTLWNDAGGSWLPLITVFGGSAIAVLWARERHAAITARSAADVERRQLRLLADAARITDGAADIDEALRRLVDLLVPDFADAAWIDVLEPGGGVRRLAARVDGPHREELEDWLRARGAAQRAEHSPTTRVLRGEGSQLAELDEQLGDAIVHDEEDRRLLGLSQMRWTMALPLAPSGGPLGALGLGVGRSGRRYGPAELAFAELLVGRAGLALANTQLVSRLTATQRRLDGIFSALADAVTVQGADGRIEYANPAAAALLGLPSVHAVLTAEPADLIGRFEIHHPDGRPVGEDELPGARVLRGERPEPLLTKSVYKATGELRWFLTKATPLRDESGELLAVNVIEDITEEHEAALRQRFLGEAGEALASSLDYELTLQRVAQLAVPGLADWCAVELPDERGTLQQVALAHADPARVAQARALRERYPPDPGSPVGSAAVMRSGEAQLIAQVPDSLLERSAQDAEHLELLRALQVRSAMSVPMVTGGHTLGVMSFVFAESGRLYAEDDLAFAQELAARAATAIENARLYTERAAMARTLQASLLPEGLPEVRGWRFAADYRPGQRGAEVGGDFYDVFEVEGGQVVLLGDVTGMGVAAAALTSLVRHTARTAATFDPRPTAVLSHVNRALRQRPRIEPVTMVCGLLAKGSLALAIGGHPLPLLKRGEHCETVGIPGLLLGAVDEYGEAAVAEVALAAGDTLLLFTDGVTDTPGADGRFGDERLHATVATAPAEPTALLAAVSAALDAFARGAGQDDRAMLALQRT
ncbi:MAG TPA: SpoIIE family protein phosphatase [Solirubrobacteraceae bacterium]|nr:SpoIIE family protein phosphatase [Solirubrobacteraceae bacterium]